MSDLVFPGTRVGAVQDYLPGEGVYSSGPALFAALLGTPHLLGNVLSVRPQVPAERIREGASVVGRVLRIREDSASLQVVEINGQPSNNSLEAVILKEHVREKQVDQVLMYECFLPGDIVEARFLSVGDGKRVFLSTREKGLGVRWARSGDSVLLPVSEEEVECPRTGRRERRRAKFTG